MEKRATIFQKIGRYLSPCAVVYLALTATTAILYIFALNFPQFANFFHTTVGAFLRFVLAKLTMYLPLSLAELLIVLTPFWITLLTVVIVRKVKQNSQLALRFSISCIAFVLAFVCLFLWMQGIGYHTPSLDRQMGLNRQDVSVQELQETAEILVAQVNALTDEITYLESGASVMPYTRTQLSEELNKAYQKVAEQYDFIQSMDTYVKPVVLSHAMSYTHITGIYTFFTGEANVNIQYPDYSMAYTYAHEMAHQRGISREDEANFVAFLACTASDSPYLRYCGYLNLYEYVANQLYAADAEVYFEVASKVNRKAGGEMYAFAKFFETYADSKAAEFAGSVNDLYLKTNGQEQGRKSYGLVVDLAVAYYRA